MTKRSTVAIASSIGLITLLGAAIYFNGHKAPASQQPLSDLRAENMEAFRSRFNAAKEQTRVILLLSPT